MWLKYDGPGEIVVRGIGPVNPGDRKQVTTDQAAQLLMDRRWSESREPKKGAPKGAAEPMTETKEESRG